MHTGTYEAWENGTIKFGNFTGTLMYCVDDKDYVYIDVLVGLVSFQEA